MRYGWIALIAAVLAGCGSSLEFRVERYDLDGGATNDAGVSRARLAYLRMHPPVKTVADRWAELRVFELEVERYAGWVSTLNQLASFMLGAQWSNEPVKQAFGDLLGAIEHEKKRLDALVLSEGPTRPSPPLDPAIGRLWSELPARLAEADLETDAGVVEGVRDQIAKLGPNLAARAASLAEKLRSVARSAPDPDLITLPEDPQAAVRGSLAAAESALSALQASRQQAERAADVLERMTGDLIPRIHEVYQDMSDPFLAFIAANPGGWCELPNSGEVSGDGDTEFVLVFEHALDGRWKTVTVDPSKVISARLQVGRRIVGSLATAIGGIATAAFAVPIPAGLGLEDGQAGTIDFSRMTAETDLMAARNRERAARIEDLRNYATTALGRLEPENAEATRQQLLRRLAGVVTEDE